MKRIKIAYMLSLLASAILVGCDNSLDETIYSEITEQGYNYTSADFDPNIAGAYAPLRSATQMSFWQMQELSSCEVVTAPNISGWNDGGIYLQLHYHNWNSELGCISAVWNGYYQGIVLCNAAIEKVQNDVFPGIAEERKKEGLAELRALRSYYYWLVCDNFGDAPLVTTTAHNLPEKSSRKEIYDFIVKELVEAIPDLSENQDKTTYGRFNKWGAKCKHSR